MGYLISILYAISKFAFRYAASYVSAKTFMTTLLLVGLPIVLNNYAGRFIEKIMNRVSDSVSSGTSGVDSIAYNFTGISAFFINHMRIDEAFSIVVSAIVIRITLSLIPFSKL